MHNTRAKGRQGRETWPASQPLRLLCTRTKDRNTNANLDSTDTLQIVSWRDLCRTNYCCFREWFSVLYCLDQVFNAFSTSSPSSLLSLSSRRLLVVHENISKFIKYPWRGRIFGSTTNNIPLFASFLSLARKERAFTSSCFIRCDPIRFDPDIPTTLFLWHLHSFVASLPFFSSSYLVYPICSQIYRNRSNFPWKNLISSEILRRFIHILLNSLLVGDCQCHICFVLSDWRQRAFN